MKTVWILLIIISIPLIQYEVNGVEYNIALNQTVTTSSVVPNHPASMVTDHKLSTYVQVDYVEGVPAWIQFDLRLISLFISKVIIWPTNDTDFELAKVSVYLTYKKVIAHYVKDYMCTFNNPVKGVPYNCTWMNSSIDRTWNPGYVLLIKEHFFSDETLKIAEIAIITSSTNFIIKNWKTVQQSNGISGAGHNGPENVIDNDITTCIYTDQSDVSKQNIRGWWRADLGEQYEVLLFRIDDRYTKNQSYRGNYMLYVDSDGFTKRTLCAFDNKTIFNELGKVHCQFQFIGRYITIERIISDAQNSRLDMLSFCDIQLCIIGNEKVFTNPQDYFYTIPKEELDISFLSKYKIIIAVAISFVVAILIGIIGCVIRTYLRRKREINLDTDEISLKYNAYDQLSEFK